MIDSRITRRYVTALYDAADKVGAADLVESDLGLVAYTLEGSPELEAALLQPVIPVEKKKEIISRIFADKIHDITLNYLSLIVDMDRAEIIKETEPEYIRIANERRGIIAAEVRTASEFTPDQAAQLKRKLEAYSGLKIDMHIVEDRSLIGGVNVRIGDTVLDGSVVGFLDRLRDRLLSETGQTGTE